MLKRRLSEFQEADFGIDNKIKEFEKQLELKFKAMREQQIRQCERTKERGIKLFNTEFVKTELVNVEDSDSDDSEKRRAMFSIINSPQSPVEVERVVSKTEQKQILSFDKLNISNENKILKKTILASSPFRPIGQPVPLFSKDTQKAVVDIFNQHINSENVSLLEVPD